MPQLSRALLGELHRVRGREWHMLAARASAPVADAMVRNHARERAAPRDDVNLASRPVGVHGYRARTVELGQGKGGLAWLDARRHGLKTLSSRLGFRFSSRAGCQIRCRR